MTDETLVLKENEVPPPDTLVEYADGSFSCLMWHFASEIVQFQPTSRARARLRAL